MREAAQNLESWDNFSRANDETLICHQDRSRPDEVTYELHDTDTRLGSALPTRAWSATMSQDFTRSITAGSSDASDKQRHQRGTAANAKGQEVVIQAAAID